MRKITAAILIIIMILYIPLFDGGKKAEAASKYITVSAFAKAMVKELGLMADGGDEENGYTGQLVKVGIIKEGNFTDYSAKLTRSDLLVLLSRADDYLYSTSVDNTLVQKVIEKRISDIKSVAASKRGDIAKGYIKGFMKGYSNGKYITSRNLKLTGNITKAGAMTCMKALKDKSLRAKISPDGQLIRNTNLPNNSYMFPYILTDYPNEYYEAELLFEREGGSAEDQVSPEYYNYPVDVNKSSTSGIKDLDKAKKQYMDLWLDKIYKRVWNTFNVDYRTINNDWIETMAQTDCGIYNSSKAVHDYINRYVKEMKENKTIVECDKVVMDSSSMYYYIGSYFVRCYVHYRIVSTNTKAYYTAEEFDGKLWGPYNRVLFSRTSYVNIENYKLGKWVDGIFDVGLSTGMYGNDGSMFGVSECDWSPGLFRIIERN